MGKNGHWAQAIAFAKWTVWVKNTKIAKNMRKRTLISHYSCSIQKNGSKKRLIFEK